MTRSASDRERGGSFARSETPATTPVIVASCADASRFRASTFTVSAARDEIGKRQRRCHLRKTYLDRPRPHDIHAPPRAHVVVRWRRVPVDPANRQARPRIARMHAQCEGVGARVHPACHVELMHGIGAGDGCLFGDQVPVQPHIRARDHAVDTQQRTCSRRCLRPR